MNMPNTLGPPMTAAPPERMPAKSQAASNEAPDGFHKLAFGLDGSGASEATLRVRTIRFRLGEFGWLSPEWRPCTIRSARSSGGEELFVALKLQLVGHHAIGVRQHAVRRDDDIAVDAKCRHWGMARPGRSYCVTSVTTLETGRWLTVGSLASLRTSSSNSGSDCTGALARIATTL